MKVIIHFTAAVSLAEIAGIDIVCLVDACHKKTDLKVFVIVIIKEGWASVAAPILLLV